MKSMGHAKQICILLLSFTLFILLTPLSALAADDISYLDENGDTQSIPAASVTPVTDATSSLTDGWYVVDTDVTRTEGITVSGDVHLILKDGASLTVSSSTNGAICVADDASLTIYGQSTGDSMGEIHATAGACGAGIGGEGGFGSTGGTGGTITINGGSVTATGGQGSAGIGAGGNISGDSDSGGDITINGGSVTATGGQGGAGIGGSGSGASDGTGGGGGKIIIKGGTIIAQGGEAGAGIGGGRGYIGGDGGEITIEGGTVTATGGSLSISGAGIGGGAGIYGGSGGSGGKITIKGGTVTAQGGDAGAGIGGGAGYTGGAGGTIVIDGGMVNATGGNGGAGIGGGGSLVGSGGSGGSITINDGMVTAQGGDAGAGIGGGAGLAGGSGGSGGSITINGATLTAQGGAYGAGIGGGAGTTGGSGGTVTIEGGTIAAVAGDMPSEGAPSHDIGGGGGGSTGDDGIVQNAGGTPVHRTPIRLLGVSAQTAVSSLSVSVSYGIQDMYTDDAGRLYLYLPVDAVTTAVEAGGNRYTGVVITSMATPIAIFIITEGGAEGADGRAGKNGRNGKDGTDGASGEAGADGAAGKNGENGKDGIGITGIKKTGTEGNVDTYTIELSDGTKTVFTVTNGRDAAGIVGARIDENGALTLSLSNGTILTAGQIISLHDTVEAGGSVEHSQNNTGAVATVSLVIAIMALGSHLGWLIPLTRRKHGA